MNPTAGVGGKALVGADVHRAGLPITKNKLAFTWTEIRGDQEFHQQVWRPISSWLGAKKYMCFKCPAVGRGNNEAYLYHNVDSTCAWDREEFGLQQFIAQRLKENQLCG